MRLSKRAWLFGGIDREANGNKLNSAALINLMSKKSKIICGFVFLLVCGVAVIVMPSKPDVSVTFGGYEGFSTASFIITNKSNRDVWCLWRDREWTKVYETGNSDDVLRVVSHDNPYSVFVPKHGFRKVTVTVDYFRG